ncbi:hypothetical protein ACXZ1K_12090 [Pedobacter sp. PWIIR3]
MPEPLSISRTSLKHWIKLRHNGQKIRASGKPYFKHLLAVAEMAMPGGSLCYEIGLCHDLIEDTKTSLKQLYAALIAFGYTKEQTTHISECVDQLTDRITKGLFPELSKDQRKKMEAKRLFTIEPDAQTVKYCDLIYNIHWMLKYDPNGVEQYLKKKSKLLISLDKGDIMLRQKALNLIKKASNNSL